MTDACDLKGSLSQRARACDERNDFGRRRVNGTDRKKLNQIVHCEHGEDPDCPCVENFVEDKRRRLTEEHAKVGAASLRRSEMERNNEQDRQKYDWLSRIIKNELGRRGYFIDKYESFYGPLIPNETRKSDGDAHHTESFTSPELQNMMQRRSQRGLVTSVFIIAMLIVFLLHSCRVLPYF